MHAQVVAESDVESVMSFLLYSGGNRFATRNWGLIRYVMQNANLCMSLFIPVLQPGVHAQDAVLCSSIDTAHCVATVPLACSAHSCASFTFLACTSLAQECQQQLSLHHTSTCTQLKLRAGAGQAAVHDTGRCVLPSYSRGPWEAQQ
jgi:hypothetical protein